MSKKLTIRQLDDIVEKDKSPYRAFEYGGASIRVAQFLNLEDYVSLINDIADGVFLDQGTYAPYLKEFCIRVNVLKYLTNCNLDISSAKSWNVSKTWNVAMNTYLFETVVGHMPVALYQRILSDVSENIKYRVERSLVDKEKAIDELGYQVQHLLTSVQELAEPLEGVNVAELLQKVAGKDEDNLVDAILDREANDVKLTEGT